MSTTERMPEAVAAKVPHLPESPGVYLWKDATGTILYVGKAKRLRSRVRSYFAQDLVSRFGAEAHQLAPGQALGDAGGGAGVHQAVAVGDKRQDGGGQHVEARVGLQRGGRDEGFGQPCPARRT